MGRRKKFEERNRPASKCAWLIYPNFVSDLFGSGTHAQDNELKDSTQYCQGKGMGDAFG